MASNLARQWNQPHPRQLPSAHDPADELTALYVTAELARRRAWLHARRWPPRERNPWLWLIVLVIVLVHVAWFVGLHSAARPRPVIVRESAVVVRLIEDMPLPVVADVPREMEPLIVIAPQEGSANNSPAPARREAPARPVAPAAPTSQPGEVDAVVATPRLYNADGSLIVPRGDVEAKPRTALEQGFAAAAELHSRGHNVVRCRRTRFAGAWKPDESVGDQVSRKYLSYIGMYNPHSAAKAAERASDATEACDEMGP